MRNIFLALLLANLGFAAWQQWFVEQPRPERPATQDPPGIILVSEMDPAVLRTQSAQSAPPRLPALPFDEFLQGDPLNEPVSDPDDPDDSDDPTATATMAEQRCISIGPYRELAQAAAAASGLRTAGHATSQRVAEGDVWVGYWVYLDGISTIAEANEILDRVREGGVADSYVISGAETGHLVSLGVFSEIARAALRLEEVQSLGLEPVVSDRTQRTTVYWVDVNIVSDETPDFDALQVPGRIMRLEQRSCPTG